MSTTVAARQALLARYLDSPKLERWLRSHPTEAAKKHGVSEAFAHWLAGLSEARVRQFRRSRAFKDRVRAGQPPDQLS